MPEDVPAGSRSDEHRRRILREVVDTHAGKIGTHYATCYRHHAGCLAVLLLNVEVPQ